MLGSCTENGPQAQSGNVDAPDRYPGRPEDLPEELQFFTEAEAERVDAVVGRILPGDEDDPGAVQGGVTIYIDRKLAEFEDFADPAFMAEPHAEGYEGDSPPVGEDGVVYIEQGQLYRYGYQSGNTPREIYRQGLEGLERYSQTRFGYPFGELSTDQQDEILTVLDDHHQRSENGNGGDDNGDETGGTADGNNDEEDFDDEELDRAEEYFDPIDPGEFFETVRVDVIEGMFADPVYGGNRNLVGWSLIGYPGAQRSYSPYEMMHGTQKQPVSLEGLTPMQPDRGDGREALEQDHDHHQHIGEG